MNIRSVLRLQDGPQGVGLPPPALPLLDHKDSGTLAALGNDGDALSNQPGLLIG